MPKPRSATTPLLQFKITLRDAKPPIWRRVVVRADLPLAGMHDVIQIAMGWMNSHLHQFIKVDGARRTYYGAPDPFGGMVRLSESTHTVEDLAGAVKQKFLYEYDFGDSWLHDLILEKILPPDPTFRHPVCLAGKGACPQEDSGGIWGHMNNMKVIANPQDPEYAGTLKWLGGSWDPTAFSSEETNAFLERLPA